MVKTSIISGSMLTIKETCKLFNVRESWLRRQIFLKTIPYLKVGRLIRFNREDLDSWIKDSKEAVIRK